MVDCGPVMNRRNRYVLIRNTLLALALLVYFAANYLLLVHARDSYAPTYAPIPR
jgi:hypothetical protein